MKIAILTCLSSFNPIYSIANIVRTQCKYFLENGNHVTLLVNKKFDITSVPEYLSHVEIITFLPLIENYKVWENNQDFIVFINEIELELIKILSDYDFIITHDFLILPMYLPLNITVRKLGNSISTKWFHWIHSKPELAYFGKKNYELINEYPLKNSFIVYPNYSDKIEVCNFFRITENEFLNVYNTLDLDIYFKQSDRVKKVLNKYVIENDFFIVYPTRLNYSKRIDKLIELTKFLKGRNLKPLVIICNSYNNDPTAKSLLEYYSLSIKLNKIESNLLFTSQLGFQNGLDNDEVNNLFKYSSFFVFPTLTETCPLVMLEAIANSNILILNKRIAALYEIAGESAYYLDFDAPSSEWLEECYEIISTEMKHNKILKAKSDLLKKYTTKIVYDKVQFNSR